MTNTMSFADAKKLKKSTLEALLAAWVIGQSPAIYRGFEDDALAFVRFNYETKADLLLAGSCRGLWAPA